MTGARNLDDARLVERIRAGDVAVLEEVFRSSYAALCEFADRLVRSREIGEELVQAAFYAVWTRRDTLQVRSTLRGYLYAAVRNGALNHLGRARLEREWVENAAREALDAEEQPGNPSADVALEQEELRRVLEQAIERLPERCRLVITLRWRHGMRHTEIAEALGISLKGVENQLARGLRALRVHLADYVREVD